MKEGGEEEIGNMSRREGILHFPKRAFILWLINMFVQQTHIFPFGAQNTAQANLIREEGGKGAQDQNHSTLD